MNSPQASPDRHFEGLIPGIRVIEGHVMWPDEAKVKRGLDGNYLYRDLRGKSWRQAERALRLEQALMDDLEQCRGADIELRLQREIVRLERLHDDLDIGTASAVYAVSAAAQGG